MAKAGMVYRPGEGEWLPSTCNGCTSFCAKQVYMLDGRALHIRGNEHSKVHGKSSCPRQYLALQELYDADRLKTPLLRTNPQKGRGIDPGFKPISWPEAINLIADKLMELRANDETHRYVALRGRYSELSDVLIKNFTAVLGSPNAITHSSLCAEADKFSSFFTEGDWGYRQYDIQDTRYILSFGVDPLSANRQVSYYSSAWGDMLDKAQVAIVDPRYSSSAAKADEWLPVIPGQDGALALALAHVILTEGVIPMVWCNGGIWNLKIGLPSGLPPYAVSPLRRFGGWRTSLGMRLPESRFGAPEASRCNNAVLTLGLPATH